MFCILSYIKFAIQKPQGGMTTVLQNIDALPSFILFKQLERWEL